MARYRFFLTFVAVCFVGTCAPLLSSAQDDHGRPPITSENAANVVLLGTAGSEPISDMIWSPDGRTLAVSTASHVQLLDSTDLKHLPITLRDPAWDQIQDSGISHTDGGGGDLAYTQGGDTLIVGHSPWLDFWNAQTLTLQGVYIDGGLGTDHFAYDADHDILLAGGDNINTVTMVVDAVTGITSMRQAKLLWASSREGLPHYHLQWGKCVSDIALSPDNQYVAIASAIDPDCPNLYFPDTHRVTPEVRVWNIARVKFWQIAYEYLLNVGTWTGPSPDLTLYGHTDPVRQVTFSPDGALIASAGLDGTVRLWSMPDGKPYAVLRGHLLGVWDVDFSPDGTRVVSAGQDGTLRLWDVETGDLLRVIGGTRVALTLAAFSPDGTRIASAGQDGRVWIFDANTGDVLDARPGQQPMWGVAFSPDGQTIATGNDANEVVLWDVHPAEPTATVRQTLHGHTGPVYDVAFSPDGTLLASASSDHTVRLWNAESGAAIAVLEGHTASVYGVAFSPDGTLLASGSWDRTARLWDVATRETIAVLTSPLSVFSVAFSPDGRLLAYGDTHLWDVINQRAVAQWDTYHGWSDSYAPPISKNVFSDDGQTLINGGYLYSRAWDVNSLERKEIPAAPAMAVHNNLLAINALGLFDLTEQQWLTEPSGIDPRHSTDLTRDLTFSPDGTLIVTVGTDGALRFWGVANDAGRATAAE